MSENKGPENPIEQQPGMRAMHELFDVTEVWQQAQDLLDNHSGLETLTLPNESRINGETSLFEELTASGDFSRIDFAGDQDRVHQATLKRLLNGWNESAPAWEKRRRFWEICEELTVHRVYGLVEHGQLPADTIVGTLSNIPDCAPEAEIHGQGYRPLNQKGMGRTYHFEKDAEGGWVRVLEQMSRSNSNDDVSHDWLVSEGIYPLKNSEGILANQFVTTWRHLPDGVVSIVKALDQRTGDVLYGEQRALALLRGRPDYDDIRSVSKDRREQLKDYTTQLAALDADLQLKVKKYEITYPQKLRAFRQRQSQLVEEILLLAPGYARDSRGELAAKYWCDASLALARDDFESFERSLASAKHSADPRAQSVCGGDGGADDRTSRELFDAAKEAKKKWKWKLGVCQVKTCGKKTEVGPCSVCRQCQLAFDLGGDPTKKLNNFARAVSSKRKAKAGTAAARLAMVP